MHWPPCSDDELGVLWMPLASARLTPDGIRPGIKAAAEFARRAATIRRSQPRPRPQQHYPPIARRTGDNQTSMPIPTVRSNVGNGRQPAGVQDHDAFRYDAFPPWEAPETWWFYCDTCGRSYTGAEINASPIIHTVPSAGPFTPTGQQLITYTRYGCSNSPTRWASAAPLGRPSARGSALRAVPRAHCVGSQAAH